MPDRVLDPGGSAPGVRPRAAGTRDWRLWALLGLFALLLGLRLATPFLDADQAVTGLMGRRILEGEFPIFYWRQEHAGVPESYGAAVTFALFGASRLALNLVPALAALGLVVALYRTGAVLFGHGAGLLAILFATAVSPYVAGHYVLARAYYIEQLLLGQLVLLGAALRLRHPLGEPARSRVLVAMGFAAGLGLYCGFQIAYAIVPAALAVLLVEPPLWRRRGAWLGLGAFLLGSTPFWIYNFVHGWATIATGVRFAGHESAGLTARLITAELFPVLLGMADDELRPYLPWPAGLLIPAVVVAAVGLLAIRVGRGVRRLRRDPALAGEALLLIAGVVTLAAVWTGGFVRVARYLLPLAPVLALVLARATQLAWRRVRPVAVVLAALYLAAVGVGLVKDSTVLWPRTRAAYWRGRAEDAALFELLRSRQITRLYALDYWLAPRLTFDAGGDVVVAQPFDDRHPPYTSAVDASPRPGFVFRGGSSRVAQWLHAMGSGVRRDQVGHYTVFSEFTAPPAVVSIPRAAWTVRTSAGLGEPNALVDARLSTAWASAGGPLGTAWVEVDLGRRRTVAGVSVVTDGLAQLPRILEVTAEDGSGAPRPVVRVETFGLAVAWRNGAPRIGPGAALTVRFPPAETRRLRLTDLGPAGTWAVAELFVLGVADGARPASRALEDGRRLETARALRSALQRYREAMTTAPDDPDGYAEFTRLAGELGAYAGSPAERAALYARLGLTDEARALYTRLAADFGSGLTHVELTERRARLAAAAGDVTEAERLRSEAAAALTPPRPVGAVFGGAAELRGYGLAPLRVHPGDALDLSYYWRLIRPAPGPLVAYVQFKGEHHHFGSEHVLPMPIAGLGEGQRVAERHRIVVPLDTPPGRYRILLGVWDPRTSRRVHRWWSAVLPTWSHTVEPGVLDVLPAS